MKVSVVDTEGKLQNDEVIKVEDNLTTVIITFSSGEKVEIQKEEAEALGLI